MHPSRRSFLTAVAAALVSPGFRGIGRERRTKGARGSLRRDAQEARLTSRPHAPSLETTRGVTQLGDGLPRGGLLYVPPSYDGTVPSPLLVALHGGGGSAGSWSRLYGPCEERGIVLLAPQSRGRTWDRLAGGFGPDVAFLDRALRFVFDRCWIDPSRMGLAGFSDGASYALSLGPSNGDLFTHLIAWSPGYSDPGDPVGDPLIFVSHGTGDQVLSYAFASGALVPTLRMDGYEVVFESFDGGHELTPPVVASALDWFVG